MKLGSVVPWRESSEPAVRDDAHDPFTAFRREVDRMFDDFFTGSGTQAHRSWSGLVNPTIDATETDQEVVITAELPGLDEKDFEVTLAGDLLTIKGEKKSAREESVAGTYFTERRFGSFSRSLRLPFEVKDEKIDATYQKGVLTIRVPRPAEAPSAVKRIEVKTA